jgi:hypothetical protein
MQTEKPRSHYVSYLLRMWETTDGKQRVWRASLERPGTETRVGFVTLDELVVYLEHVIEAWKKEGAG